MKYEEHRYFTTSLIFLFLAQAISLLIRMGSRIIIARFSSPDIYGLYSVIWNEMTLISTIALLGLGQQLTINLPRENNEKKKQSILSAIIYASIMGIVSLIISIIFYFLKINNSYKFSFLISALFIIFLFIQFIFIGLRDFLGFFIQSVTQNLSMFIIIIIIREILTLDIIVYVLLSSIGFSVLFSALYILIRTKMSLQKIKQIKIKLLDFNKKRISLFLVDIINSLIFYLLLKLPQIIIGNSYAGFVNIAFSLVAFLIIPPQMIAIALGPKISEYFHNSRLDKLQNSFRMSFSILYIFQGIIVIVFTFFGDFFLELLYGNEYLVRSRIIFYGFLLAVIIDSFNYQFAFYIRNTDNEKLFAIGKIISLIAFIIPEITLLFVLNDYIQAAVPVAYLISTLSLLAFYFFFTLKLNKNYEKQDLRIFLSWLAFIFINNILALVTIVFIQNLLYVLFITLGNILIFIIYLIISKTINFKILIKDLKEIFSYIKNKNGAQLFQE